MSQLPNVRTGCAPPIASTALAGPGGAIRWICTKNPFYVVSAGLFLVGLWISFGDQGQGEEKQAEQTWALLSWLAGYTLLLAGTAYLLVRFANVWDDVRTVLLLVVLMFLATSVTFDDVLVQTPDRGVACYLLGFGFAIAVSEGLLRGIRLRLPAWFRVPYYLILALFFLYPLALIPPAIHGPMQESQMWGIGGFAAAAALVFLSLVPAIRRGAAYLRDNGSPWPWPLYPWTLFGMLALAVPARAFLLSWSMHLPEGGPQDAILFAPFFLVPFGLALAVLLLEMGLVSRREGLVLLALVLPAGLVVLANVGYRTDPINETFLRIFTERLGGTPLFLTLLAAVGFYAYAALRRVPLATAALTAALVALAVAGRAPTPVGQAAHPQPALLLAAALLQLCLGIWRRDSWHCLAGCLLAVLALSLPGPFRGAVTFHLTLIAFWLVGAAFDDALGRLLRMLAAVLVLLGALAVRLVPLEMPGGMPPWSSGAYPLVMAGALLGYGLLLRHRPSLVVAGLVFVCWLGTAGWQGYRFLRQLVRGLDYIAVSLAVFALAVLISLGKSGMFGRRAASTHEEGPLSIG